MSLMERRLQLLLDQHRYDLVAGEAQRSGRSVAAVIRESIDRRFDNDDQRRMAGARRFLELTAEPDEGPAEEWADIKASFDQEISDRLERAGIKADE